jgi:transposase
MEHYAGIDVSLERSSVCVVDALGKIVKEAKISSEPAALVAFFEALGFVVKRIGLEAGPLSQWLHAGLQRAGFEAVLLETRHVKAALSAMTVKTDRKDARGLAQLIRMGWFRPVHAKSIRSQEVGRWRQRWSAPLVGLCFDRQPVPCSCHVHQDGLDSQIRLALGHSPTLRGLFLALNRMHNALPNHLFRVV